MYAALKSCSQCHFYGILHLLAKQLTQLKMNIVFSIQLPSIEYPYKTKCVICYIIFPTGLHTNFCSQGSGCFSFFFFTFRVYNFKCLESVLKKYWGPCIVKSCSRNGICRYDWSILNPKWFSRKSKTKTGCQKCPDEPRPPSSANTHISMGAYIYEHNLYQAC